jgi:hypothetical protein
LSPSYAPTELKRRLKPALDELEEKGFLEPLLADERYSYLRKGQWRVLFIRGPYGRDDVPVEAVTEAATLIAALIERGVAVRAANDLVAKGVLSRIRTKIEVYDWLVQNEDKRVAKNPAGYLVASIRADYEAPSEYASKASKAARHEEERRTAEAERRRKAEEEATAKAQTAKESALRARWESLTTGQREAISTKVRTEHPGLKRWKAMLEPLCLAELERLLAASEPIPSVAAQATLFAEERVRA